MQKSIWFNSSHEVVNFIMNQMNINQKAVQMMANHRRWLIEREIFPTLQKITINNWCAPLILIITRSIFVTAYEHFPFVSLTSVSAAELNINRHKPSKCQFWSPNQNVWWIIFRCFKCHWQLISVACCVGWILYLMIHCQSKSAR